MGSEKLFAPAPDKGECIPSPAPGSQVVETQRQKEPWEGLFISLDKDGGLEIVEQREAVLL